MPVQINEVIIRAVVDPAPAENVAHRDFPDSRNMEAEVETLEKILEILKEKQER